MTFQVRKPDGWTTVSLPNEAERVAVASDQTDSHLSLMLIDSRHGEPNAIVQDAFDVYRDPLEEPIGIYNVTDAIATIHTLMMIWNSISARPPMGRPGS